MAESKTERLPLYKKVTNQLREQCVASAGEMLPPLRQLSQMLDVNHATISRALRDLEQEGLVEIVPRKGIFSVPQTTDQSNIELVVLVSERSNLLDVALRIMEGMHDACRTLSQMGKKLTASRSALFVPTFPDVERFVGELKSRGTTGVVFLGFGFLKDNESAQEEEFIAQVAQKMPVVLIGSSHSTLNLDCVYGDPRQQMQQFLDECYAGGLRRFEYLGDRGDNLLQRERRECFSRFMHQHELDWQWGELKPLDTPELAAHLNTLSDFPEVVVATNVRRALTVTLEAQRRGLRLPEELRVLCFASLLEHAQPLLPYASVIMLDEPAVGFNAVQLIQGKKTAVDENQPVIERVSGHFVTDHFVSGSLLRVENPLEPAIA